TETPATLQVMCASPRFFPCIKSIGLGRLLHQFGGSTCCTVGLPCGATACRDLVRLAAESEELMQPSTRNRPRWRSARGEKFEFINALQALRKVWPLAHSTGVSMARTTSPVYSGAMGGRNAHDAKSKSYIAKFAATSAWNGGRLQCVGQNFLQVLQKLRIELCVFRLTIERGRTRPIRACRQIEDVDRDFAFRIDQGDGYVAILLRQNQAETTQQAWSVLRDDLQNCAVGRGSIVDSKPGFDACFMVLRARGVSAGSQHVFHGDEAAGHIGQAFLETFCFSRI